MSAVEQLTNKLTAIADAIRNKNGLPWTMSIDEMPVAINNLEIGSGFQSPADIYNHGAIIGVNPYYNSIGHGPQSAQYSSYKWVVGTNYISAQAIYNKAFAFMSPIIRGKLTKLYVDCEVTYGNNGEYNNFLICYRNPQYGALTDYATNIVQIKPIIWYGGQMNCMGTTPWYTLPRSVVEVDITSFGEDEPWWLVFKNCDCDCKIYSIWLK